MIFYLVNNEFVKKDGEEYVAVNLQGVISKKNFAALLERADKDWGIELKP